MKRVHFSSISDYHQFAGKPAPEHPLISVSDTKTIPASHTSCQPENVELYHSTLISDHSARV